ncbi:MAG: ASKHA domain-containing protein [Treponema sp.]|nr:ASKHA domain-containing protein [Treponema sp.]
MPGHEMFTVLFKAESGSETSSSAAAGETILDIAQRVNVPLDAPCAGNGTCGKCRIKLLEGTVKSETSRHIPPPEFAEGWRLACTAVVESDLTVLIPIEAAAYRNKIKVSGPGEIREQAIFQNLLKELRSMGMEPGKDCGIEITRAELSAPVIGSAAADRERLLQKLAEQSSAGQQAGNPSLHALRRLPGILRQGNFTADCVIRHYGVSGREKAGFTVLDVFPPMEGPVPAAGLAIDIGTTSVSALLVNLSNGEIMASASAGNAQIRYGADVISRIIESGRPGGLERLRYAIINECLIPLIVSLCEKAEISPGRIYRAAIAGNTTMTHLFLGVDPAYLRLEPYVPAFFESGLFTSAALGLPLHPEAEILTAPAIGSYVGGDITAGVFASMIFRKNEISLLIDLGTNGELVLGNAEFLISCACSAGPAFEGGDISCGMRAVDGAIEACTIDKETMEPEFTVIGPEGQQPLGLCGSGLIDITGELFRCGLINARGKFIKDGKRILRDKWGGAGYALVLDGEAGSSGLMLTETDIDNFIRAKGAIFSAIRTMLAVLDFEIDAIEKIHVAGGIGGGINIPQAIRTGMLPNLPPEKYHYIGNSSLYGAYAMLASNRAAAMTVEISRGMTYIELSNHPGYMDELVAACFLPHTNGDLFRNVV